jgi:hypothetical protein
MDEAKTSDAIDLYCCLVEEGAEVGDPRLLRLLEQMSWPEIDSLKARLRGEGQALLKEANALETDYALRKCGVRIQRSDEADLFTHGIAPDDDIDF